MRLAPWRTALLIAHASCLGAQALAAQRPDRQLTVDASALGAAVTFAVRAAGERGTFVGFGAGVGGDFVNATLLGGRHFSEDGFTAYEDRDASGGEQLFEIVHVKAFARCCNFSPWQIEYGLRASGFLHSDDSDDDPGGALFVGAEVYPTWGTKRFRVGPRLLVGRMSERRPEVVINASLLTGRVVFMW
jgi:hypothetical protein